MRTASRDRARAAGRRTRAATDRRALVHQRGHGHPPAVAHATDAVGVGHADVGEVDLVELGLAGHLAQRTDLDARRVHVEREVGEPLVLRGLGVGAGDEHAAVGDVGQRVPDLLAVDHPLVAVAHGPTAQAGQVGPGTGLAEELAPGVLAGEQRGAASGSRTSSSPWLTTVGPAMASPKKCRAPGDAAPAWARRRSTSRCMTGGASSPPQPVGKWTQANPRSYCRPRRVTWSTSFGSTSVEQLVEVFARRGTRGRPRPNASQLAVSFGRRSLPPDGFAIRVPSGERLRPLRRVGAPE